MANEVEIVIVARDQSAAVFEKARANAKRAGDGIGADLEKSVGTSVQKIGADVGKVGDVMAKEGEKAGKSLADGITKGANGAGAGGEKLAKKVLGDVNTFNDEGSRAGAKIAEGIGRGIAKVGSLIGKAINAGGEMLKSGSEMGKQLAQGIQTTFSQVGQYIGPPLIASAVAIAPVVASVLGAAVSGALIAAVGIGGIVAGVMLVKDNPAVKSAADSLAKTVGEGLSGAVKPFVPAVVAAIGTIKTSFSGIEGNLKTIFANAATWVQPMATAIGSMMTSVSSGLATLFAGQGGSSVQAFADGLVRVGDEIKYLFEQLNNNGAGAATGIAMAFAGLVTILHGVTNVVTNLAGAFGFLASKGVFGDKWKKEFEDFKTGADGAKSSAATVAESVGKIGTEAEKSQQSLKGLSDQLRAQTDPLFALGKAQQDVSTAQDKLTAATSKFGGGSKEAQAAALALGQATIILSGATGDAAGKFSGTLTPAMRAMMASMNLSKTQIDAVEKAMQGVTKSGTAMSKTYTATIKQQGAQQAQAEVNAYDVQIKKLKDRIIKIQQSGAPDAARQVSALETEVRKLQDKKITITTEYKTIGTIGGTNYKGFASGGIVGHAAEGGAKSNTILVGEQGPELVNLAPGSSVTPAGMTRSILEGNDRQKASQVDNSAMTSEIVRAIKNLGRSMEQMRIELDGRELARIQGRSVDLLTRAG